MSKKMGDAPGKKCEIYIWLAFLSFVYDKMYTSWLMRKSHSSRIYYIFGIFTIYETANYYHLQKI